jgi:predicted nucleotidyltransferase
VKLTPAQLRFVRRVLQKHVPGYPVWAFGSRVHGRNLKLFSDLDLAVISEKPLRLDDLIALRRAFSESDLPFRVDVVDYAAADVGFRSIIRAEHEIVTIGSEN